MLAYAEVVLPIPTFQTVMLWFELGLAEYVISGLHLRIGQNPTSTIDYGYLSSANPPSSLSCRGH
jgi:hypothetical protein